MWPFLKQGVEQLRYIEQLSNEEKKATFRRLAEKHY